MELLTDTFYRLLFAVNRLQDAPPPQGLLILE